MKDTIDMAREVGLHLATDVSWMPIIGLGHLKDFEALVRADEREAMVAEAARQGWAMRNENGFEDAVREIATIRARGNT